MTSAGALPLDIDELYRRRVPCMIAFLRPFRIIDGPTSPAWEPTIEQINSRTWDYVELHRMVAQIDVGLPPPYNLAVARDGAFALPALPELRKGVDAAEFFNQHFAALLLGGIYCEAIAHDALDFGSIIDWSFIRVNTSAPANRFNQLARLQGASPIEAIALQEERRLLTSELDSAMLAGRAVMAAVPEMSGEFLLKGTTGFARRDWSSALANLWIVVEQITSNLWQSDVVGKARAEGAAAGRIDQLGDTRTWSTGPRHELLYQTGRIGTELLAALSTARRARNALAHRGSHPSEDAARAVYYSVIELLKIAASHTVLPLAQLDVQNHTLSDPFVPTGRTISGEPKYWMPIPKLPGEAELELLEGEARERGLI
ncbi:hypothetical protein [Reyranella aquatilis]|nr:hypothetical protein [Reyranella aquatilis]